MIIYLRTIETGWNLEPRSFTGMLAHRWMSPLGIEWKQPITPWQQLHPCLFREIMNKIQRPKLNCQFWGVESKTMGLLMIPAYSTTREVERPPKLSLNGIRRGKKQKKKKIKKNNNTLFSFNKMLSHSVLVPILFFHLCWSEQGHCYLFSLTHASL